MKNQGTSDFLPSDQDIPGMAQLSPVSELKDSWYFLSCFFTLQVILFMFFKS